MQAFVSSSGQQSTLEGAALREAIRKQVEDTLSSKVSSSDPALLARVVPDPDPSIGNLCVPLSAVPDLVPSVRDYAPASSSSSDLLGLLSACLSLAQPQPPEGPVVRTPFRRSERNTVIIREAPQDCSEAEVRELFALEWSGRISSARRETLNGWWFVTFAGHDVARDAMLCLAEKTLRGQPVRARVKTENVTRATPDAPAPPAPRAAIPAPAAPVPAPMVPLTVPTESGGVQVMASTTFIDPTTGMGYFAPQATAAVVASGIYGGAGQQQQQSTGPYYSGGRPSSGRGGEVPRRGRGGRGGLPASSSARRGPAPQQTPQQQAQAQHQHQAPVGPAQTHTHVTIQRRPRVGSDGASATLPSSSAPAAAPSSTAPPSPTKQPPPPPPQKAIPAVKEWAVEFPPLPADAGATSTSSPIMARKLSAANKALAKTGYDREYKRYSRDEVIRVAAAVVSNSSVHRPQGLPEKSVAFTDAPLTSLENTLAIVAPSPTLSRASPAAVAATATTAGALSQPQHEAAAAPIPRAQSPSYADMARS